MEAGGEAQLWAEAKGAVKPQQGRRRRGRPKQGGQVPTLAEHNARRVRTLVQERQYSRAAQALCLAGMAQPNRDTLRVMHAKHLLQVPPSYQRGSWRGAPPSSLPTRCSSQSSTSRLAQLLVLRDSGRSTSRRLEGGARGEGWPVWRRLPECSTR